MKIGEWLAAATKELEAAEIGTARLDTLVLLEDAMGHDRTYLLAHPEEKLAGDLVSKLASQLKKRAQHEPLAYIRGKTEFYGREFLIDERVLEPRPESETMIDSVKELASNELQDKKYEIIDVGTGSGALAITAKLELPKIDVVATEIDPKCLVVARQNAKKHKVNVKFHQGDLLRSLATRQLANSLTILLCNLPYVPDNFTINQAAMNEPRIAIFGGPDGLDIYRKLFGQIDKLKNKPEIILTESLPFQHKQLAQIAKKSGYDLQKTDDFIQLFETTNYS